MQREKDELPELIEMGTASADTQGGVFGITEPDGLRAVAGLSDD